MLLEMKYVKEAAVAVNMVVSNRSAMSNSLIYNFKNDDGVKLASVLKA